MVRLPAFEEYRRLLKSDQEACLFGLGLQAVREEHAIRPPSFFVPFSCDVGVVSFPFLSPRRADETSDLTCCGGDYDGDRDGVAFDDWIDWKARKIQMSQYHLQSLCLLGWSL